MVHENQNEYYRAIQLSNNSGESTIFVEFMLQMILDVLKELSKNQNENNVVNNVGINEVTNEEKLLMLLRHDGHLTGKVLASSLGITIRQVQRMIFKLKQQGKVVRHGSSRKGYWEVK